MNPAWPGSFVQEPSPWFCLEWLRFFTFLEPDNGSFTMLSCALSRSAWPCPGRGTACDFGFVNVGPPSS